MKTDLIESIKEAIEEEVLNSGATEAMAESWAREELIGKSDEKKSTKLLNTIEKIKGMEISIPLKEELKKAEKFNPKDAKEITEKALKKEIKRLRKIRDEKEKDLQKKLDKAESLFLKQKQIVEDKADQIARDSNILNGEITKMTRLNRSIAQAQEFFSLGLYAKAEEKLETMKITPLQEILEKTGYCTVIEKEPGFLYRIFHSDVDKKTEELLNSKVVTKIRYRIKELSPAFLYRKKEEIIEDLEVILRSSYEKFAPNLVSKYGINECYRIESASVDNDGNIKFTLYLNTDIEHEFVIMEAHIDNINQRILLGSIED